MQAEENIDDPVKLQNPKEKGKYADQMMDYPDCCIFVNSFDSSCNFYRIMLEYY